jgi:hypothetical protein
MEIMQNRSAGEKAVSVNTLTVTDNRTNRTYTIPVEDGTVRAMDFRQMKEADDDFGLMLYDPAFVPQWDHLHRRRSRHSGVSRLSD